MKKTATKTRRAPTRTLTAQALDHRVRLAELSATNLAEITGGASSGPPKASATADPGIDLW